MKKHLLKELADIQLGYAFRSRLESIENGRVGVIQMKDLSVDNIVNCENITCIEMDNLKECYLAKQGDLIFRSRGLQSTAAILQEDVGCTVIAAPLYKIRVKDTELIKPEYLCWYIAQRAAQAYFTSRATGTLMRIINKPLLEELEIVVPSITAQERIIQLVRLTIQEAKLLKQLASKREQYISNLLMTSAITH